MGPAPSLPLSGGRPAASFLVEGMISPGAILAEVISGVDLAAVAGYSDGGRVAVEPAAETLLRGELVLLPEANHLQAIWRSYLTGSSHPVVPPAHLQWPHLGLSVQPAALRGIGPSGVRASRIWDRHWRS